MYAYDLQAHERAVSATQHASSTLLLLRRGSAEPLGLGVAALAASLRHLTLVTPQVVLPPPPPKPAPLVVVRPTVVVVPIVRRLRDPAVTQQTINGCKALLLEILRRAAYDWVLYRESTRLAQKKLAEDAYLWLFEERIGHQNWNERVLNRKDITSFESICEALDLDPRTVRRRVRGLTTKHVMNVGRPAEYRRHDLKEEGGVGTVDESQFEHVSYENLEQNTPTDRGF